MSIAKRVFASRPLAVLARAVSALAIWVVLGAVYLFGLVFPLTAVGNICASADHVRTVEYRLSSFDWLRGRMHCVYADGAELFVSRRDLPIAMVVWTTLMLALAIAGSWLVLRGIRRNRLEPAASVNSDEAALSSEPPTTSEGSTKD